MPDIHDVETRSRNMRAIRGSDTKPELVVRKGLHAQGFRYVLGGRGLPGRPDLVLPRYRSVVFVHGCFWHGHGCSLFHWPASRSDFWQAKISANVARDERVVRALIELKWNVATVWECAIRGRRRIGARTVIEGLGEWLSDGAPTQVDFGERVSS
ncbi:DNA mismatch endonuclease Vsr [Bacillus sp. NP157]|nr:DNA mismatch endonuclease Vsr [Bacillus sp. NP157]